MAVRNAPLVFDDFNIQILLCEWIKLIFFWMGRADEFSIALPAEMKQKEMENRKKQQKKLLKTL